MHTKNNPTTSHDGKSVHCPSCGSYCNASTDLDAQDYCNDCRPDTKENRLKEILGKFENGQDRYDNDPTFRVHIEALLSGIGVYAVLDGVLKANKVLQSMNAALRQDAVDRIREETKQHNENPQP